MRTMIRSRTLVLGGALALLSSTGTVGSPAHPGLHKATSPEVALSDPARITAAVDEAFSGFVPNRGQMNDGVLYASRSLGHSLLLTVDGVVLAASEASESALALSFIGANSAPRVIGRDQLPGTFNFLLGNDPEQWHVGLPRYGKAVYEDIWAGIDAVMRGGPGQLTYEFVVDAGVDPSRIRLAYEGAKSLSIDASGDMTIHTPLGPLRDSRPVSYQILNGRRVTVDSRFAMAGESDTFGFTVGAGYDPQRRLVIDPVLDYSTLLGGSALEFGSAIAVDDQGSPYVAGSTYSADFPTTPGAFDPTFNGGLYDAFVAKMDPAGSRLVYSTFLGGSGSADEAFGLAVDHLGRAYVTGQTLSPDFPTTPGAFDRVFGVEDAFVTRLDPSGSSLEYSTFLGGDEGRGSDIALGIAVGEGGSAFVTGHTYSTNFPTTPDAFDGTFNGVDDAFITKFAPDGSSLEFSTYLGGFDSEWGREIALDRRGLPYVSGFTASPDFPTTQGAFDRSFNGVVDAFVAKLDPTGTGLVYATYVGGRKRDGLFQGMDVDEEGNVYVVGDTMSSDFPTTPGSFDTTFNGRIDAFVFKLNRSGSGIAYSTYVGGPYEDLGHGLAVDRTGHAFATGWSLGRFPVTLDAYDRMADGVEAFLILLSPTGTSLTYSTYLGGSGEDLGKGIALDQQGDPYVTGETFSADFPTTEEAFDRTFNGETDAFVTKFDFRSGMDPAQPRP